MKHYKAEKEVKEKKVKGPYKSGKEVLKAIKWNIIFISLHFKENLKHFLKNIQSKTEIEKILTSLYRKSF